MTKTATARIYRGTSRNLAFLAAKLRAGELVAVPTETVYGLAANALDPNACRKIFSAKGRPTTDPLIVHVHATAQLEALCEVNDAARALMRAFWPGPLTLVLPKKPAVPDLVTAGRPSVAVRMPAHPLFRRLLRLADCPLAAPSANPFGYVSPTTAEHVKANLGSKIRYILDGGPARVGVESTIVDLRDPRRPTLLRPGAVTAADLRRVLRTRIVVPSKQPRRGDEHTAQLAPGMLARHYSPRTPVVLHEQLRGTPDAGDAYIFLRKPAAAVTRSHARNHFWFDAKGDLRGVARRLFATLRRVDAMGFKRIHVERAPGNGLADAINDRLRRAAAK